MLQTDSIATVIETLSASGASVDVPFLEIGETLQTAIGILAKLGDRFDTILVQLRHEDLNAALKGLSRAADRFRVLGASYTNDSIGLDRLQVVTEAIAARVVGMIRAIGEAGALAINAKIAAANINVSGVDFTDFASEVTLTLRAARGCLETFHKEVLTVRDAAAVAFARQQSFAHGQAEAISAIHKRLVGAVSAIGRQQLRAAQATAEVKRRSASAQQQVGVAVMGLQIGDTTRQRIEHVVAGLGLLTQTTAPAAADQPVGSDAFQSVNCRLQSALLFDAAQQFDRTIRQIGSSLRSLANAAQVLRDVRAEAFGADTGSDNEQSVSIEDHVNEALDLCGRFSGAQQQVLEVAASISQATASLCSQLGKVHSLEADIRIMGLNTTLKCDSLGRDGLALSLVAQELRTYSNEFAKEANVLLQELEGISTITEALRAFAQADRQTEITQLTTVMRESLHPLSVVRQALAVAVEDLERESVLVATLLRDTAAAIMANDDVRQTLLQAADTIAGLDIAWAAIDDELTEHDQQLLGQIARSYTMVDERVIHERSTGLSCAAPASAANLQADLEDILF